MEVRLRDLFVSSFFYPSLSYKVFGGRGEYRNDSLELTVYNRLALNVGVKAGTTTTLLEPETYDVNEFYLLTHPTSKDGTSDDSELLTGKKEGVCLRG